ncbi:hypothetical protein D9M71_380170 [compost metagenome]
MTLGDIAQIEHLPEDEGAAPGHPLDIAGAHFEMVRRTGRGQQHFLLARRQHRLQFGAIHRPVRQHPALPATGLSGQRQGGGVGVDHPAPRIDHQHRVGQLLQQQVARHRQQVEQAHAEDQEGEGHQGEGEAEGRGVEAEQGPAVDHIAEVGGPGHAGDQHEGQVMAAMQTLAGQGGAGHHRQAEDHEDIDVDGHGIEQRAVVIADRRARTIVHRQGAGAVEQLVPGIAQGHGRGDQRAQAQQQEATQPQGFTDAVDELPEEYRP